MGLPTVPTNLALLLARMLSSRDLPGGEGQHRLDRRATGQVNSFVRGQLRLFDQLQQPQGQLPVPAEKLRRRSTVPTIPDLESLPHGGGS